jgi:hypothetical protein
VAYTAANLEPLLDQGAQDYVNHPRGARMKDGRLYVSSIYVWFKEDFGGNTAGIVQHIQRYAVLFSTVLREACGTQKCHHA